MLWSSAVFVIINVVLVCSDDSVHQQFFESNRQFSGSIYKELAAENAGNFAGCPMSTEIVLSMVHAGARKQTASQLAHGLSLPNNSTQINAMVQSIMPNLVSVPKLYTLKTVNKMYVDNDLKISKDFQSTVVDVFKSEVENIDFKQKEETVSKINGWVAESTEDYIKNLIKKEDVNEDTKAVLLNSIFFQATWSKRFHEEKTKKLPFYTDKVGEVEVDMMEQTDNFEYHESDHLKAKFLKMAYIGDGLSMVVVLPNEKDGLKHVETNIHAVLEEQKFQFKKVRVQFPKFKLDSTIKFIPILRKLGVVDLFEPSADLSGISADGTPLYISEVIQKNYVEVNEKGTIAASATAAFAGLGAAYNPEAPKEFIADHPFLFYIESKAGILFIGRHSGH